MHDQIMSIEKTLIKIFDPTRNVKQFRKYKVEAVSGAVYEILTTILYRNCYCSETSVSDPDPESGSRSRSLKKVKNVK